MSWTFTSLARAERTKHEELLRNCAAPNFADIVGWEWRGWNVLFAVAKIYMKPLRYERFMKGFFRRAGEGDVENAEMLHGYNVRVLPGGLDEEWVDKKRGLEPFRHSFFDVYLPGRGKRFNGNYSQALFLDYGVPENGLFDGKDVRDFLVQVTPDLLLGKAYMKLLGVRFAGSYFVLERLREHNFRR